MLSISIISGLLSFFVAVYLYSYWLPHCEHAFFEANIKLPSITIFAIGLGHMISKYWLIIIPVVVILIVSVCHYTVRDKARGGFIIPSLIVFFFASLSVLCYLAGTMPMGTIRSD